jgi:hypothetical protein
MMNRTLHHIAAPALAMALALSSGATCAQSFTLEGAVIDSRNSKSLGVVTERGDINTLFRAQKSMSFGILRSAGVSLEQLSPEVRARIERFQTTNLDAFRAFSQGLDLKDQGKFAEAKEQFRRAAELDPGFGLAAEQQQAMPDVNVSSGLQLRAVRAAAAGAAVDRGKAVFAVDLARAVAAMAAGQTVVATASTADATRAADDFTTNPPGSGTQLLPSIVAGLSYSYAPAQGNPLSVASVGEWKADKYRTSGSVLDAVGSGGDFLAQRLAATASPGGSAVLADNSTVYWGSWLSAPGASAAITVAGVALPSLGRVDYVFGDVPRALPTTGSATFTPTAGMLPGAQGSINVNFGSRDVTLQNLGFAVGNLTFAGLNGTAGYDNRIASGPFSGNFTSGTCTGCVAFAPLASGFGGSFLGSQGHGLLLSTILVTGNGTASGIQLFTRPGGP